jgi:hypothetical protein
MQVGGTRLIHRTCTEVSAGYRGREFVGAVAYAGFRRPEGNGRIQAARLGEALWFAGGLAEWQTGDEGIVAGPMSMVCRMSPRSPQARDKAAWRAVFDAPLL